MTSNQQVLVAVLLVVALAPPSRALGDPGSWRSSVASEKGAARLHLDVEVDPTAYLLNGYSAHLGVGWERLRLDLGAFAADVPRFLHGNAGFSTTFHGYGAKLQLFLAAEQAGPFVGVEGQRAHQQVRLDGTGLSSRQVTWSAGVDAGWRFTLGRRLYLTPWVGLQYSPGARDVTLDGRTFRSHAWTVYPAVHVGYRFQ
jgi:hypothetical protein